MDRRVEAYALCFPTDAQRTFVPSLLSPHLHSGRANVSWSRSSTVFNGFPRPECASATRVHERDQSCLFSMLRRHFFRLARMFRCLSGMLAPLGRVLRVLGRSGREVGRESLGGARDERAGRVLRPTEPARPFWPSRQKVRCTARRGRRRQPGRPTRTRLTGQSGRT